MWWQKVRAMKKQLKREQNTSGAKQNSTPSENKPSVSDETKQKLVKQYADRAEKESSKQNPVDWGYFNSPKFGSPVDERKQIADRTEASPSRDLPYGARWGDFDLPKNFINSGDGFPDEKHLAPYGIHGEGLNGGPGDITQQQVNTPWNLNENDPVDNNAPLLSTERLQGLVNSITNNANKAREDTNIKPNMLYGYGDAPLDYDRYEFYDQHPEYAPKNYLSLHDYLDAYNMQGWLNNTGIAETDADKNALSRAFLLMQNANNYDRQRDLEQMAQQSRDRDLYGDALMELMAQRQAPQNNRSILNEAIQQVRDQEILENRPSPRRRNITGSAVW